MDIKTAFKILLMFLFSAFIFFVPILLVAYIGGGDLYSFFMGFLLGTILLLTDIYFLYPYVFKDYIKEYWEKEEAKKNDAGRQ